MHNLLTKEQNTSASSAFYMAKIHASYADAFCVRRHFYGTQANTYKVLSNKMKFEYFNENL